MRAVAGDYDFDLAARTVVELSKDRSLGLLLIGKAGVGKTSLAEIIYSSLSGDKHRINCWESSSVDDLVPESDKDINGYYNSEAASYMQGTLFIDDLGTESIIQRYGNSLDRVGNYILRYYEHGLGRLIVTTNFSGDYLEHKYGSRVFDRLLERCLVVKFSGESKRIKRILS